MAKILRILGKVYGVLATLIMGVNLFLIFLDEGFGAVQDMLSPFNTSNFIVTMIIYSPAIGLLLLADKLEKKREEKERVANENL